jgi:hypothetical protein
LRFAYTWRPSAVKHMRCVVKRADTNGKTIAGGRTAISVAQTRCRYVGFKVLTAVVMKTFIFWDITLCIRLKLRQSLRYVCFMLIPYLACSSTLKMEAICSSETSVFFNRTTCRIPGDRILQYMTYVSV